MAKKKWIKAEKNTETAESKDSAARKDDPSSKPFKGMSHKKTMKKMYRGEK